MILISSDDIREIGETVKLQLSNIRNIESELRIPLLDSPDLRLKWNGNGVYSLIVDPNSISSVIQNPQLGQC